MLNTPKQRTVELVKATYIDAVRVEVGERRTLGAAVAAELVTARKAKFVDPDPVPVPTPQAPPNELPEDHPHVATAKSATKGK